MSNRNAKKNITSVLEEIAELLLSRTGWADIIYDKQVRVQVARKDFGIAGEDFVGHQIPDQIEDGLVQHEEPGFDGLIAAGSQFGLKNAQY